MDEKSNGNHFLTPDTIKVKIQSRNVDTDQSAPFALNFYEL